MSRVTVVASFQPVMETPNEVVTWTQYLTGSGEKMQFGISAASSQTWGDFSGQSVVVPTDSMSHTSGTRS